MAKIKIKEGSCEIWHEGKPNEKLNDKTHKPKLGHKVRIHFVGTSHRYTFKDGKLET